MIVSFTPKEILFASDSFRYYVKEGTSEDVLNHTLEINHGNLKEYIETFETNCPKIHKITRNVGLICGGDGRFADVIEGLNPRKSIAKQIMERLQQKGKITAFWECRIGSWKKARCTLTQITYKQGEIEVTEHTKDVIGFDSFAPEMQKRFPFMPFYMANRKQKIEIINEFFKETTKLYNGMAGGVPTFAILNEKGFQGITTQNFTGYSYNWMPEKIETISTSTYAWSSTEWTDILTLNFECESTMLIILFADISYVRTYNASDDVLLVLAMDDSQLSETASAIGSNGTIKTPYSMHSVQIPTKGSHHIDLKMKSAISGHTVEAYGRRLSILKGFYQGGTT